MSEEKTDFLSQLARKPPAVKIALLLVTLALLGFVFWQFLYTPVKEERESLEAEIRGLVASKRKLQGQITEYNELKAGQERLKERQAKNDKRLPLESDLLTFVKYIESRKVLAQLPYYNSSKKGTSKVGEFTKTTIEVEIKGTFYQILNFFYMLSPAGAQSDATLTDADAAPMVTIENLEIEKPAVEGQQIVLGATFLASTFHWEGGQTTAPPAQPGIPKPRARGKAAAKPGARAPGAKKPESPAGSRVGNVKKDLGKANATKSKDAAAARKAGGQR